MCAWSATAPDGTKSVKANETIIQGNTTYTETELNKDHFWNIGADEDGRHKFAQMPKYEDGVPATPTSPTMAAGMDLAYFSRLKTATESVTQQDVQPYARNASAIMQILGIRACVLFNFVDIVGAQTLIYSHNVSGVARTADGLFVVTYSDALPSPDYLVLGGGIRNNADVTKGLQLSVQGSLNSGTVKSVDWCKVVTHSQSGNILDPLQAWIVCFGG